MTPDRDDVSRLTGTQTGVSDEHVDVTLSEERAHVYARQEEAGRVRASKTIETSTYSESVPREVEHAELERAAVTEGDSGEVLTLPDGSISIPVFEEEVVITKRRVLRERVVLRKQVVVEQQLVTTELRRERLDVEVDGDVRVTGDLTDTSPPGGTGLTGGTSV